MPSTSAALDPPLTEREKEGGGRLGERQKTAFAREGGEEGEWERETERERERERGRKGQRRREGETEREIR